jgi:uncharacterized membrane protein YeiB
VFFDAVDQTVRFGFGGGTMALHTVTPFGGTIVGFSKTGATAIDFEEFDFGASTTATYSGTTSGGVLTLTEGRATASVTLVGNYTRVTFNIADDGTGMALVTASMAPGAAAHAMSTAMAAFAPASSAALTPATRDAVLHHPMLAVGRMSLS